jgi:hypothetical protein
VVELALGFLFLTGNSSIKIAMILTRKISKAFFSF